VRRHVAALDWARGVRGAREGVPGGGGEGAVVGKRQRAAALHTGTALWSAPDLWRFALAWDGGRAWGEAGRL
jgi:hypothetical protein